jgi:hypothetical protein
VKNQIIRPLPSCGKFCPPKVRANEEKYNHQFQLVFEVLDQLIAPENEEEIRWGSLPERKSAEP